MDNETPFQVITKHLRYFGLGRHTAPALADEIIDKLNAAGFYIVKREPYVQQENIQ